MSPTLRRTLSAEPSIRARPAGSSIAEDRKVEPTKALAVGEEVDPGDLPARDREADCDARPSAAAPTRVPRLYSRAPDEPAHGSSSLALYRWDALAEDAGVAAEGSGFRGITLSYIVRSEERVDAVLAEVERAGGKIAKPAQHAPWG
jgi:hypothetical protein